ncbi:hypothetical protein T440DRAFT_250445 [Plenodomus tracheiphilus IPT5]|uniref:Uncharacterized protein n=1 Tax=Plenodomus tracheiphilus IPT5 TaxID=1408161 RepID=A0A6A7AV48_9PLEO|nr:hypothetical protein T440DRAFT_250445 [Plenodomus tracheiphilus IPT5]
MSSRCDLLLDRGEVYGNGSSSSLGIDLITHNFSDRSGEHDLSPLQVFEPDTKPHSLPEDLDVDLLLSELLSMAPVTRNGKKRGCPTKQAAVKQQSPDLQAKQRATPTNPMTNDTKKRKTEASSRGTSSQAQSEGDRDEVMAKVDTPDDVEIIEISDGEPEDVKPLPWPQPFRSGQPSPKVCDHTQELQRVREELASAMAETVTARAETEATQALLCERDEEIKALRAHLGDITRERDQLQVNTEKHRSTASDHALVIAELKDTQKVVQSLTQELFHTQSSQSSQASPTSSFSLSQQRSSKLATPPPTPTFATSLDCRNAPSASPFRSSASVDEQKNDGIRKTYVKIKMKYDSLHSLLINLETCTRSMDLSSFGEFGRIMRQLRAALEKDRLDK